MTRAAPMAIASQIFWFGAAGSADGGGVAGAGVCGGGGVGATSAVFAFTASTMRPICDGDSVMRAITRAAISRSRPEESDTVTRGRGAAVVLATTGAINR